MKEEQGPAGLGLCDEYCGGRALPPNGDGAGRLECGSIARPSGVSTGIPAPEGKAEHVERAAGAGLRARLGLDQASRLRWFDPPIISE